jgi:hypothetical protein
MRRAVHSTTPHGRPLLLGPMLNSGMEEETRAVSDAFTLTLSAEQFEQLVSAVADVLVERASESNGRSPWLTASEAADYLRWPVKRIYNLTSTGAIPHRKHRAVSCSTATSWTPGSTATGRGGRIDQGPQVGDSPDAPSHEAN